MCVREGVCLWVWGEGRKEGGSKGGCGQVRGRANQSLSNLTLIVT